MTGRGEHKISGPKENEEIGCLSTIMIFAIIILLAFMSHLSDPIRPDPPHYKQATFYSSDLGENPLVLSVTGGSYILKYEKIDAPNALLHAGPVFRANFVSKEFSGDLNSNIWILCGNIRLTTGSFSVCNRGKSDIVLNSNNFIKADFSFNIPKAGAPLVNTIQKVIYFIDGISNVTFDGVAGNAELSINILELDPTPDDLARYERKLTEYNEYIFGNSRNNKSDHNRFNSLKHTPRSK